MYFNIQGREIDIELPRSLSEAAQRIQDLKLEHAAVEIEIKPLPKGSDARRAKADVLAQIRLELQILSNWRKNTNVQVERRIADTSITNSAELRTPAGLIRHLTLILRKPLTSKSVAEQIYTPDELAVLSAAQHWLREHYSATLAASIPLDDEEPSGEGDRQETQLAIGLLNQFRKSA